MWEAWWYLLEKIGFFRWSNEVGDVICRWREVWDEDFLETGGKFWLIHAQGIADEPRYLGSNLCPNQNVWTLAELVKVYRPEIQDCISGNS